MNRACFACADPLASALGRFGSFFGFSFPCTVAFGLAFAAGSPFGFVAAGFAFEFAPAFGFAVCCAARRGSRRWRRWERR